MPPEISPVQHDADVNEEGTSGGIFSKIPIWAWIGAGIILLYVLYTKLVSHSTSKAAVSTQPSSGGMPTSNLDNALGKAVANQSTIQDMIDKLKNPPAIPSNNGAAPTASPISERGHLWRDRNDAGGAVDSPQPQPQPQPQPVNDTVARGEDVRSRRGTGSTVYTQPPTPSISAPATPASVPPEPHHGPGKGAFE